MSTAVSLDSRNATEQAILDAARLALAETSYEKLTIDAVAKRAFVSRTTTYFYFANKRELVDRLIQSAFTAIQDAADVYLRGSGDPRQELRTGMAAAITVVSEHSHVMLLAARLSRREPTTTLPQDWTPFVSRLVDATARRIARDQQRGVAPADIPPRLSAQALLAMVESHIVREVLIGGGDAKRPIALLAELWWRAVYARPEDILLSHDAPA